MSYTILSYQIRPLNGVIIFYIIQMKEIQDIILYNSLLEKAFHLYQQNALNKSISMFMQAVATTEVPNQQLQIYTTVGIIYFQMCEYQSSKSFLL